jgi:hypothetical protein
MAELADALDLGSDLAIAHQNAQERKKQQGAVFTRASAYALSEWLGTQEHQKAKPSATTRATTSATGTHWTFRISAIPQRQSPIPKTPRRTSRMTRLK